MCGLAGFIDLNSGTTFSPSPFLIEALSQRGPDSLGCLLSNVHGSRTHTNLTNAKELEPSHSVSYAHLHSRLTLTGAGPTGLQPFLSSDRNTNYIWTHNGQIYNHQSIAKHLKTQYPFTSSCDSEVIGPLIYYAGIESLSLLEGQFAFAFHDPSNKRIILARDRYGQKPLYYLHLGDILFYSSSINILYALLQSVNHSFEWTISDDALLSFLENDFIPPPLSLWKDVRRLSPGQVLTVTYTTKRFRFETTSLWSFAQSTSSTLPVTTFDHIFSSFVQRATASDLDQRICIGLSGGLDSTSIAVATLDQRSRIDYITLSGGNDTEEVTRIDHLTKQLAIPESTYILPDPNDPASQISECFSYLSEPTTKLHDVLLRHSLFSQTNISTRIFLSGGHADFMLANGRGFWDFHLTTTCRHKRFAIRQILKRLKYAILSKSPSIIHSFGFQRTVLSCNLFFPKRNVSTRLSNKLRRAFSFLPRNHKLGNIGLARILLERSYIMMLDDEIGLRNSLDVRDCFLSPSITSYINSANISDIYGSCTLHSGLYRNSQTDHKPLLRSYLKTAKPSLEAWLNDVDKRPWGVVFDEKTLMPAILTTYEKELSSTTLFQNVSERVSNLLNDVYDSCALRNKVLILTAFLSSKPFRPTFR